MLDAINPD